MGVKEWLIPQEQKFFDLLAAISSNLVAGSIALCGIVDDFRDLPQKRKRLKDLEHKGDEAVHQIHEALNRTFITPIDREDIVALANQMDNILDMIYASALRLEMYEVKAPTPSMVELTGVIRDACGKVDTAVKLINNMRNGDRVEALAVEINQLENAADEMLNRAVADLFQTSDPIRIIKLKEIYENMEEATDHCEDVADTLSDIVAKNR